MEISTRNTIIAGIFVFLAAVVGLLKGVGGQAVDNKGVMVDGENSGTINNIVHEGISEEHYEKLLEVQETKKVKAPLVPNVDGLDSKLPNPCSAECIRQGKKAVVFGSNAVLLTLDKDGLTPFRLGNDSFLSIRQEGDLVFLSIDFYENENSKIASLVDNELVYDSQANPFYEVLRPTPSRMVIYDNQKKKVLDVNYVNEQTLEIKGLFRTSSGRTLEVFDQGIKLDGREFRIRRNCFNRATAIFSG